MRKQGEEKRNPRSSMVSSNSDRNLLRVLAGRGLFKGQGESKGTVRQVSGKRTTRRGKKGKKPLRESSGRRGRSAAGTAALRLNGLERRRKTGSHFKISELRDLERKRGFTLEEDERRGRGKRKRGIGPKGSKTTGGERGGEGP